jgi:hypothetical protein
MVKGSPTVVEFDMRDLKRNEEREMRHSGGKVWKPPATSMEAQDGTGVYCANRIGSWRGDTLFTTSASSPPCRDLYSTLSESCHVFWRKIYSCCYCIRLIFPEPHFTLKSKLKALSTGVVTSFVTSLFCFDFVIIVATSFAIGIVMASFFSSV